MANTSCIFKGSYSKLLTKFGLKLEAGQKLVYTDGAAAGNVPVSDVNGVLSLTTLAGGGALTGLTQGSVAFAGPLGVLAQDNANFFWDDTNNRLGVCTASPLAALHVDGTTDVIKSIFQGGTSQTANITEWRNVSGTVLTVIGKTGKLGIGVALPVQPLEVVGVLAGNGDTAGQFTTSGTCNGGQTYAFLASSTVGNGAGTAVGVQAGVTNNATTNIPTITAFNMLTTHQAASGTCATNVHLLTGPAVRGGCVTTNLYHIKLRDVFVDGGSSVTRQYGLHFPAWTSALTNYGIYFEGSSNGGHIATAAATHFTIMPGTTGGVGINNLTPGAKLHVSTSGAGIIGEIIQGFAGQTADLQQWQNSSSTAIASVGALGQAAFTGLHLGIRTVSSAPTITAADYTINVDCTSAAITVALPAVATNIWRIMIFKKIDSSANALTIDGNASETIDGALTKSTVVQYDVIRIQSNGSAWYQI